MSRFAILFHGHLRKKERQRETSPEWDKAIQIAKHLGKNLIQNDYDVVLYNSQDLDGELGKTAVETCQLLNVDPNTRITTYFSDTDADGMQGFGKVLKRTKTKSQDFRTYLLDQCDALITCAGGNGTADLMQKARLAKKPVFPIAIAGGTAEKQWRELKEGNIFYDKPDELDVLADHGALPEEIASAIIKLCDNIIRKPYSRRIFIVHGHDSGLKNELARFLEKLEFKPVILQEQTDKGRSIFNKLKEEMADIGFGFILLTPDDVGGQNPPGNELKPRARQNVIFEHGLLIGALGAGRVCAVVKGDVEIPSDLYGIVYKKIPAGERFELIAMEILRELRSAGYEVDANKVITS